MQVLLFLQQSVLRALSVQPLVTMADRLDLEDASGSAAVERRGAVVVRGVKLSLVSFQSLLLFAAGSSGAAVEIVLAGGLEVDLGLAAANTEGLEVVRARRSLSGGESAKPDPAGAAGVTNFGSPGAPGTLPDAAVLATTLLLLHAAGGALASALESRKAWACARLQGAEGIAVAASNCT